MTIYQILPRLWGDGKFSSLDEGFLAHIKSLGVSHAWYTGIPRHATGKAFVKGCPGSPYAISDWYDVNHYLASDEQHRMEEFKSLVARTHAAGLKVITDFIPNHVACDFEGDLPHFDFCDYDWTDTLKVDYSSDDTVRKMTQILLFWAGMGVDGFRCDMVEMVPRHALGQIIAAVKNEYPQCVFIAEAYGKENYAPLLYEVGFDFLYDKSGLYDVLRDIVCRGGSARQITWNWQWLSGMQPRMLNFLENHDEQRVASPQFAGSASRGYSALAVATLFNSASFMLYFGQEAGENAAEGHEGRTSIFEWANPSAICALKALSEGDSSALSSEQASILERYRATLTLAGKIRSWSNYDLCWCNEDMPGFNADKHFAFMRYTALGSPAIVVACNFSGETAQFELRIPEALSGEGSILKITVPAWDFSITEI